MHNNVMNNLEGCDLENSLCFCTQLINPFNLSNGPLSMDPEKGNTAFKLQFLHSISILELLMGPSGRGFGDFPY